MRSNQAIETDLGDATRPSAVQRERYTRESAMRKLLALILLIFVSSSVAGEQKNVVFNTVPDFLKSEWTIVLGPSPNGGIANMTGSVLIGHSIVMFTNKENAKVVGDYSSLEIVKVIQYNLRDRKSESGYHTFFHLVAKDGDTILYPGAYFWHICLRYGNKGPYAVYAAIRPDRIKALKKSGLYDSFLEEQKSALQATYRDLSLGLEQEPGSDHRIR